jgi:hypothetical protein
MLDSKCSSCACKTPTCQVVDAVRPIRDEIDQRVRQLLVELGVAGSLG